MVLLQQMIVLFLYMIVGFCVSKKGIFDEKTSKNFSWLVINIANPALALNASINGEGRVSEEEMIHAGIIAIVMYVILVLLAQMIPVLFKAGADEKSVYKVMTIFNNIGFMGFPVIAAAYGNEALMYAIIFSLPSNMLTYTYGIALMRGKSAEKEKFRLGKFLNVGVVACVLSLIIYLFEIPMCQVVKTAVGGFSGLTGPMSMMVIGISLSALNLKELFMDAKMLLYAIVKLLIVPISGLLIIRHFITDEMLLGVCMVMLATPVASMSVMLAYQYDRNVELASKGVAITTILSVITIPLVSALVL